MYEKALLSLEKSAAGDTLLLSRLNETILRSWIDEMLPRLAGTTVDRYVESLHTIYKWALRNELATDAELFTHIKEYLSTARREEGNAVSRYKVEVMRRLATERREVIDERTIAIDAYLYAFYQAGLPMDEVVMLRFDAEEHGRMPHTALIRAKYLAPIRRYVFPLQQRQRTLKKIREELDAHFQLALASCHVRPGNLSSDDFVVGAWIAAARACGISLAEICACCRQAQKYARFKGIQPADLSEEQIEEIKLRVANSIVDRRSYWYALRFLGEVDPVCKEIEQSARGEYRRIYYPMEEICRKKGKKRITESRPTIRNILFLHTMPNVLTAIVSNKTELSRFSVIRNNPSGQGGYAIIPDAQMRRFSMLVSNGLEILGEEELQQAEIELGSYVRITEGMFKGYNGRVIKVTRDKNHQVTMLRIQADTFGKEMEQVLGKHLYITIPQGLVSQAVEGTNHDKNQ